MRSFKKTSLASLECLFLLLLIANPAPAADGLPPAESGNVLLGPSARLNDKGFNAHSSVTGTAGRDYWNPSAKKMSREPGIQGYKAHTKNATIATIAMNERTGQYTLSLNRPGVTSVFFTDEKNGKVPRYGVLGELITVIEPAEFPILRNQPVDIIVERNFLRAIPGEILRLTGIFRQELTGQFTLNFTVVRPDGWRLSFSTNVRQSRFAAATDAVLYEEPIGEAPQVGQYNVEVILSDAARRPVAINRFDVWIGGYGFPGRTGSPVIDKAELWVLYEDFSPNAIAISGRFPQRLSGGARLYLDNRLISTKIERYESDQIIFNVQGTSEKFPATRQRLVVVFEDIGYSLVFNYDNPVDPQQVEPLKLPAGVGKDRKGGNTEGMAGELLRSPYF
jgi:hypothetical protein